MRKRKKRSIWPVTAAVLLLISLTGNVIFSVLYVRLAEETKKTVEQMEMRVEEYASLMQERQDALAYEKKEEAERDPVKETEGVLSETEDERMTEPKETEIETERETEKMNGEMNRIAEQNLNTREQNGEKWALCVENLENNQKYGYNSSEKMQSASVIKVFIMATVYDRMCYPASPERLLPANEAYDGELRALLEKMITVSDNEASNTLITKLGQGDFKKGAEAVNQFCQENGYTSTSVGRKFLETNPTGDNYTSAADCTKILSDIYHGTCVGEEASEKMLTILKQQTNTSKIPAGLPSGTITANKTGEMPEGYGLGCIENDMAIVFNDQGDYVITVLSNELSGRNEEAKAVIRQVAGEVAQVLEEN